MTLNHIFKSLLPLVGGIFFLMACVEKNPKSGDGKTPQNDLEINQKDTNQFVKLNGTAQGGTYHVTYKMATGLIYKDQIDSILLDFDNSLSSYNPGSLLTEFNAYGEVKVDQYFKDVFLLSKQLHQQTRRYFNPAIYSLIDLWGIDFKDATIVSKEEVDSILSFCDFDDVYLDEETLVLYNNTDVQLEFNAVAQGYSADVIGAYLDGQGVHDYLVEIGGEMTAKGLFGDRDWIVGIEKPQEKKTADGEPLALELKLINKGLATSGNYRKFKEVNGKRYAHILNPFTGFPAENNLLSATVIAKNAAIADAYATAFMVMGLEKTIAFLKENKVLELDVFLIYFEDGQNKTHVSPGIQKLIVNKEAA